MILLFFMVNEYADRGVLFLDLVQNSNNLNHFVMETDSNAIYDCWMHSYKYQGVLTITAYFVGRGWLL